MSLVAVSKKIGTTAPAVRISLYLCVLVCACMRVTATFACVRDHREAWSRYARACLVCVIMIRTRIIDTQAVDEGTQVMRHVLVHGV